MTIPSVRTHGRPTMYFIGVTTAQSCIMRIFPEWMQVLGRAEVVLQGIDLPLQAPPRSYRTVVEAIKNDPLSLGALVTTHKLDLLAAARDLFDSLDANAALCNEISSISKNGSLLDGQAKDPVTAGLSIRALLGDSYFARTGGEVLCLGAGGAATAIVLYLASLAPRPDRPRRITVVDRLPGRLATLRAFAEKLPSGLEFAWHCHQSPEENDALLPALPESSLVINATGMGKDLPGSPLTAAAQFPRNGVAWELNYRGERRFLAQALGQRESRGLQVEDGWTYFLHGWTSVIEEVVKVRIDAHAFTTLARIARQHCRPA